MKGSARCQPAVGTAVLAFALACPLSAVDWSAVPVADFVARAKAAAGAQPKEAASTAARILNAAMPREDLADGQLFSFVSHVYAIAGAMPTALARAVYVRIEPGLRPRAAAILAGAAPAGDRQQVANVIRVVNRPPPPGVESTMREIRLRAIAKE